MDIRDVAKGIGAAEIWVNDTIECIDHEVDEGTVILTFDNGKQFAVIVEEI